MSGTGTSAFNPRVMLGLVLFGVLAFLATLYFIGSGQTGKNGVAEADVTNRGLNGYVALYRMLERQGHDVSQSRSRKQYLTDGLLVLTPSANAEADDIRKVIEDRRYIGPTLLIIPKWVAIDAPRTTPGRKPDWVMLGGSFTPEWVSKLGDDLSLETKIEQVEKGTARWSGLGKSGALPSPEYVQAFTQGRIVGLAEDAQGRNLVGYMDDGGCYPVLDRAVGLAAIPPDDCTEDQWNVTVVAEPDLMNNYGLADRNRALFAAQVVNLAREGMDLPIVFDTTLSGAGGTQNLLTLAFTPPFLAATLCLLIAMLIVGWRAFRRFGPPMAEGHAIAFGKRQLVANAAGFTIRSRRLHLLTAPYAALVARRLAAALGLRSADAAAIDAAVARRAPDAPVYSHLAARLSQARGPSEILRAAHALKSLERTIAP